MKKQLILALALLTVSSSSFALVRRAGRIAVAPVAAVGVGRRTGRRTVRRAERRGERWEDGTEMDEGLRLL